MAGRLRRFTLIPIATLAALVITVAPGRTESRVPLAETLGSSADFSRPGAIDWPRRRSSLGMVYDAGQTRGCLVRRNRRAASPG